MGLVYKHLVQGFIKFITYPLRILYLHGPSIGGYGFKEGNSKEIICSHLTNVRSEFWSLTVDHMNECETLIEKKFYAFVLGFFSIAILCILFLNLYLLSIQYYIRDPINAKIEKKFDNLDNLLINLNNKIE